MVYSHLGRHAWGGQSQLDMPERFLLDSKMVGERTRQKTKTGKKESCRLGKGQRPGERGSERNPVIIFMMYSNGEERMG